MPLTAEIAAQQVKVRTPGLPTLPAFTETNVQPSNCAICPLQDRLRSLQGLIHDIDNERRRSEPNIQQLLRTKDKLAAAVADDQPPRPATQQQLKRLYKLGLSDAAAEEALIRQALAKVHEIRAIRNECRQQASRAGANKGESHRGALMKRLEMAAHALPLFVGKPGERIPALCGAVPADAAYVAKPGDMVAALVKHSVDEDNCITAEVVAFLPAQNKYELDDIDEEVVTRHVVARGRVVPLPLMRANPETEPSALFACGTTGEFEMIHRDNIVCNLLICVVSFRLCVRVQCPPSTRKPRASTRPRSSRCRAPPPTSTSSRSRTRPIRPATRHRCPSRSAT